MMARRDWLDLTEPEWAIISDAIRGSTIEGNRHIPMPRTPENGALIDSMLTRKLLQPMHTSHEGTRYEGFTTTERAWRGFVEYRTPRCQNCGLRLRGKMHLASCTTGKGCNNPVPDRRVRQDAKGRWVRVVFAKDDRRPTGR